MSPTAPNVTVSVVESGSALAASFALRVTVSSLAPPIAAIDIAPPTELTVRSDPSDSLMVPPAKFIAVPAVVNVVAAVFSSLILSPVAVVNVVTPPPKV